MVIHLAEVDGMSIAIAWVISKSLPHYQRALFHTQKCDQGTSVKDGYHARRDRACFRQWASSRAISACFSCRKSSLEMSPPESAPMAASIASSRAASSAPTLDASPRSRCWAYEPRGTPMQSASACKRAICSAVKCRGSVIGRHSFSRPNKNTTDRTSPSENTVPVSGDRRHYLHIDRGVRRSRPIQKRRHAMLWQRGQSP